ncbi:ankyrin repeat domain-containing protein [Actinoplanes friuliensis]|uniref:Ankyrin-2 n=1 Tax=Actinoplanes friuliensis DSM 7358 TaxID=1246995 RepID=U5W292_9ACTN|nr:ankyrin repeat domain-containing protein [Actinoplanes friuliensis]AGZ42085.1 Ankyrin-2 [Actinoplanes friuliensis DSM 7358]
MERRRERERYARDLAHFMPPGMVTVATERRLAGDWRGACEAAMVDVHIDLADVARTYGAHHAARIEADLRGLAPDLLRRFLPRSEGLLRHSATVVLFRHEPLHSDEPRLIASLPRGGRSPRQAIALRVGHRVPEHFYDLPDWAWHADAVAARRWACGASDTRLPWHFPDGTPYPQGTVTPPEEGADRPAVFERISAAPVATEAFAAAGLHLDPTPRGQVYYWHDQEVTASLAELATALPTAHAEITRLTHRYARTRFATPTRLYAVNGTTVAEREEKLEPGPRAFGVPAPMDAALLRQGDLTPDDLHPLIHEALFPGRVQKRPPPAGHEPVPIRVRCGTEWHTVIATGGRLLTPHHDDAEIRREFVLAGLGGPIGGCAAAVRAWRSGAKPIPKAVRKDRQDLFALALHGDTDGLLARLADGIDPALRTPGGGTLLHLVAHVDHRRVLPVLLAAGFSLDDRDHNGRTPLHAAAESGAEPAMAALAAAGANPTARDNGDHTAATVLSRLRAR